MIHTLPQLVDNPKGKRVLVCPLYWGMGHATRSLPIVNHYLEQGCEVWVAGNTPVLSFYEQEQPKVHLLCFDNVVMHYQRRLPLWIVLLWQLPKFVYGIAKEHRQLRTLIRQHHIDLVISDNRYGLWTRQVPCVFITHQLMVKMPKWCRWIEPLVHKMVLHFVRKYTQCWVPDREGNDNLSGDLAHKYPLPKNVRFIGTLSRFSRAEVAEKKYAYLVLLSGPEPQRTVLENKLKVFLLNTYKPAVMLCGKPEREQHCQEENLLIVNHASTAEIQHLVEQSEQLIVRSGYSTLMDLEAWGKTAIIVPTPHQTEQEYLAALHSRRHSVVQQREF